MPIVGGKWFPAVDGHAAQRTVTVAKGFVSLRFADDLLVRFADASQFAVSSLRVSPIVSLSGVHRGCWMVVRSLLLGPLFHGLSTPQRQQLSIRGEDLSHGVL